MPSLYAPMSGVNTKQKSVWGLMSGVNTKMKTGYGLDCGINTKIYLSRPDFTIQEHSDDYAWAGLSYGALYVAAETGNHYKNAGVIVKFVTSLYVETIYLEIDSSEWSGSNSKLHMITYHTGSTGATLSLSGSSYNDVRKYMDRLSFFINDSTSSSGYFYAKPIFYLRDGSSFTLE